MVKSKFFRVIVICLIFSPLGIYSKEQLARVAVLYFYDNTGTSDFGYMPGSLRDAILLSMHKKFEFKENSEPEILMYFPVKDLKKRKDEGYIKRAAAILKSDIIIYGSYSYNKTSGRITITPKIYFAPINDFTTLQNISNPVDNTIFQVTDRVSANLVKEINRMLDIHNRKFGSTVYAKEEKKIISKESLETRAMVWAVGGMVQMFYNPVWNTIIPFTGFSGEQYFNTWFSGYGSIAYGYYNGHSFIKIPSVGLISAITALLIGMVGSDWGLSIIVTRPGILAMDGVAINLKIGKNFQVAPFIGLNLALPLGLDAFTYSVFGSEAGLRFHLYDGRLRATLLTGIYYTFQNVFSGSSVNDISFNTGFSFAYLTGK